VADVQIERAAAGRSLSWQTNAWLFVATVASMFFTQLEGEPHTLAGIGRAAQFAGALTVILLAHEFGHYVAARIHKVDASLPFFIPLPRLSPFGTMGAVIQMRGTIPTRRALLDIGASGPLAGLVFAIPLYAWGVAHSRVIMPDELPSGPTVELGTSLLTRGLDALFAPHVPEGGDILLSPVAFAGWAGMFVTMINLLPVAQLDGGHVAYALFGPRQNRIAEWVHRSLLAFFFVSLASFVARDLRAGLGLWHIGRHVNNALLWLVWFELLPIHGAHSSAARRRVSEDGKPHLGSGTRLFAVLGLAIVAAVLRDKASPILWGSWFVALAVLVTMEVRWGALRASSTLLDHPPTGPQALSFARAAVAILTLAFFVLLFMPTPFTM
jgi:membrane-associated protease RseP (regulator of RpoE activity)